MSMLDNARNTLRALNAHYEVYVPKGQVLFITEFYDLPLDTIYGLQKLASVFWALEDTQIAEALIPIHVDATTRILLPGNGAKYTATLLRGLGADLPEEQCFNVYAKRMWPKRGVPYVQLGEVPTNLGNRVLIIDDVITTGSTVVELAKAVKKTNPQTEVDVITMVLHFPRRDTPLKEVVNTISCGILVQGTSGRPSMVTTHSIMERHTDPEFRERYPPELLDFVIDAYRREHKSEKDK